MSDELWRLGVGELTRLISSRTLSSREVVAAHLERIESINSGLNAVTESLETALGVAAQADTFAANNGELGALHGVPFSVKESVDLAGSPTTKGLVSRRSAVANQDAPHVALLRTAGAIPLARTNLPELGMRWHTTNDLHGATVNPYDASRSPGGSSGGDAVAVATGMVPLGLGTDLGGSLRVPAEFCGVVSLRPSTGRIKRREPEPGSPIRASGLMTVDGPLVRSVADLRLVFDVLAPERHPVDAERPDAIHVLRGGVDPQVDRGIDRAASALIDAGFTLIEGDPPKVAEAFELWRALAHADARGQMDEWRPLVSASTARFIDLSFETSRSLSSIEYVACLARRVELIAEWEDLQSRCPIVLGPVSTRRPFLVGEDERDRESVAGILDSLQLTLAASLLDLPALVVPVGEDEGLPQVVQIIGPHNGEERCFAVGVALEEVFGPQPAIDPRSRVN